MISLLYLAEPLYVGYQFNISTYILHYMQWLIISELLDAAYRTRKSLKTWLHFWQVVYKSTVQIAMVKEYLIVLVCANFYQLYTFSITSPLNTPA